MQGSRLAWESEVPTDLLPAILHLRNSLAEAAESCGRTILLPCVAMLHNCFTPSMREIYTPSMNRLKATLRPDTLLHFDQLLAQGTPPATFMAFFELYQEGVATKAVEVFHELMEIGRKHERSLRTPYIKWARNLVVGLIEELAPLVGRWIKLVSHNRGPKPWTDEKEEMQFWRDWRAPMLLFMAPAGELKHDDSTLWQRVDDEKSKGRLTKLAQEFGASVADRISGVIGDHRIELAKERPAEGTEQKSATKSQRVRKEERRLFLRELERKYKELVQKTPGMSRVWYSEQLAKKEFGDGKKRKAETLRRILPH
jgi:hypothetical protein